MRTREQSRAAYSGLRASEVAEMLGCSKQHVITLVRAGDLDAVDISAGSRIEYRISRESFEAFLRNRKVA